MNPIGVLFGLLLIAYGIATFVLRLRRPDAFRKLRAMKKQWGDGPGFILHVISYTLLPLVAGVIVLAYSTKGKSLF